MARYENPPVRDGINVAPHSAAREFIQLSIALALGVVVLVAALVLGFRWLAPLIPFSVEQRLAAPVAARLTDANHREATQYLQNLAEQLATYLDFPSDMQVQVHYSPQPVANAFATLGGHVTLYQGLIDHVYSENGLAMVLAHELAHIRHRDPLVSAGSGMLVTMGLGMVLGSGSESVVGRTSAAMMQLQFSRRQERAADAAALRVLQAHYGHVHGAEEFFSAMTQQTDWAGHTPEFLRSHPDTDGRLAAIQFARDLDPADAVLTALPAWLKR